MIPAINHSPGGSACYPGWYAPSGEVKTMLRRLDHSHAEKFRRLHVKLSEFDHHYQLILQIPNVAKEEIVVYTHDGRLMIALKNRRGEKLSALSRRHSRDYSLAAVVLPSDADVEFSSAECRKGRLEICLSKTIGKKVKTDHHIIVY